MAPNRPMVALGEAKKNEKVKHIGITSHQIDFAKEAVKSDRFETIMFPFNFVTDEPADELLPLARKHDVGFIVMKPLVGGMLANVSLAFKYLLQFPDVLPIPGIERICEIEEIAQILMKPRYQGMEREAILLPSFVLWDTKKVYCLPKGVGCLLTKP